MNFERFKTETLAKLNLRETFETEWDFLQKNEYESLATSVAYMFWSIHGSFPGFQDLIIWSRHIKRVKTLDLKLRTGQCYKFRLENGIVKVRGGRFALISYPTKNPNPKILGSQKNPIPKPPLSRTI